MKIIFKFNGVDFSGLLRDDNTIAFVLFNTTRYINKDSSSVSDIRSL